jgi:hypothetical protein
MESYDLVSIRSKKILNGDKRRGFLPPCVLMGLVIEN